MQVSTENEDKVESRNITIHISDDIRFRISLNKFGELVINKICVDGSSSIAIEPRYSNEIIIK